MKILIVKLWALGDILVATPLLRALRRQYPGCHITWLADSRYAEILKGSELVDEVIAFNMAPWLRYFRAGQVIPYLKTSFALRRKLNAAKFDMSIALNAEKWWMLWFNAAPVRIGLFPGDEQQRLRKYYTSVVARMTPMHTTDSYLLTAISLGVPEPFDKRMVVAVTSGDRKSAQDFLDAAGYDPQKPIVLLHPGASQDSKCWPAANFGKLADLLSDRCNLIVTGSPGETELARRVAAEAERAHPIVAAGALSNIRETAALVEMASVVVTGDTSLLHIASALDTPLVAIYGSTRPRDYTPLFGRSALLYDDTVSCAPCYKANCPLAGDSFMACMRGTSPERVWESVEAFLADEAPAPSPSV
ncbi:ADP-heptose--LPS heptosyltransferase II [Capsulimonas corticalis]|uniref:ADP-heptose--LPS heptosyltransferase II n=1 Tax=Capsulimonas corticalis TaxID=2219043 RepID=A0A402CP94_9BACT|nr:glycosyltransferase family 9 protein [Capsulimonas corticalis]BDI33042.1 ADP-heptose--LPS heptosyltransferase II [Capsulimonas corticalis]